MNMVIDLQGGISVKNGCKDFVSPVMDKLKVKAVFENRIDDIIFAQIKLKTLNRNGECLEETMQLMQEMYDYIIYLYSHIEQIEKDKKYLLEKTLKYRI